MDLEAVRMFVKVAELQSFTRAAEQLGASKARVSLRLSQLEAEVGTRLLQRTTRMVRMTEDGLQLFERGKRLLSDADELQTMFQQAPSALRGRVRLDLPVALARDTVIPRLPELLAAHPQLELSLSTTDRRVDLLQEGFDCVLRVGALRDSHLMVRRLGALEMVNCASPAYLLKHGTPRTLADLADHLLVAYSPSLNPLHAEFEYREGKGYRTLPMRAAIVVNSTDAYNAACLAGLGIIQAPRYGKTRALAEGRVVELLRDFPSEPMPVSLLYGPSRSVPRRVRAVMAWLAQTLAPLLSDQL